MKKSLCILLVALSILACVSSCDISSLTNSFHRVTVTGSENALAEPLKPFYAAGDTVRIKAYAVTDVSLYVFVNGERVSMCNADFDYWEYEFIMPDEDITVHLTFDRFYGRDEYDFKELYWFTNGAEDSITMVITETCDIADKTGFIVRKTSTHPDDIAAFREILSQKMVKAPDGVLENESVKTKYMFAANGLPEGVFSFTGNYLWWNDFASSEIFEFKDKSFTLPTINHPEKTVYMFQYDGRSSDVKSYLDPTFSLRYTDIGSVEFVPYEGVAIESEAVFYLDSRYGKINLIDETIFELNGNYYKIVKGKDYWAYNLFELK